MPTRRTRSTARGRPTANREVSPRQIVDVTLQRIRDGGFANVSMRQVADDLGLTATALYNHFPNKDALLDAVAERIYESIPIPSPRLPWTVRLHQWLLTQERLHLDHPGLARFLLARHSESTAAYRWIDSVLQILSEGGLADEAQVMCMRQIGFLHNPLIYLDAPQRKTEARVGSVVDPARQEGLEVSFPHLARLVGQLPGGPNQSDFEEALARFIDGLEAALGKHAKRPVSRRVAR